MKKYEIEKADIWVSDEILKRDFIDMGAETEFEIKEVLDLDLSDYLNNQNQKYVEYSKLYGKLNRFAMLNSHGGCSGFGKDRKWIYSDNGKDYLVQDWIDSVGGKYNSLLFSVCNPGACEPISEKSLLFVPDRDVGGEAYNLGTCYHLYVPEIGVVDSYTIDYELKKLGVK